MLALSGANVGAAGDAATPSPTADQQLDIPGTDECQGTPKPVAQLTEVIKAAYEAALTGTLVVSKPTGFVDTPGSNGYSVVVNGVTWVTDGVILPTTSSSWPADNPSASSREAIVSVLRAETACRNTGDGHRYLSLYSDQGLSYYVGSVCCTFGVDGGQRGTVLLPPEEWTRAITEPAPPRTGSRQLLAPDIYDIRLISETSAAVVVVPGTSVGEYQLVQEQGVSFPRSPQIWLLDGAADTWELIGILPLRGFAEDAGTPIAGS